jgi:hypothetical protein
LKMTNCSKDFSEEPVKRLQNTPKNE